MNNKLLTRKNFFTIAGIGGLGLLIIKNTPLKKLFSKNNAETPIVTLNPLAVKRENRGKLNG